MKHISHFFFFFFKKSYLKKSMDVNSSSVLMSVQHRTADIDEPLQGRSLPDFTHDSPAEVKDMSAFRIRPACRIRAISLCF